MRRQQEREQRRREQEDKRRIEEMDRRRKEEEERRRAEDEKRRNDREQVRFKIYFLRRMSWMYQFHTTNQKWRQHTGCEAGYHISSHTGCSLTTPAAVLFSDRQEYIRRQLEEEQRHLEMLQEQLLREQAMLLVSHTHKHTPHITSTLVYNTAAYVRS